MRFGIPLLDNGLSSANVLLRALPGVDATPFVDQAIAIHGGDIIYLTVDRPAQRVRDRLQKRGVVTDSLTFLDGHHPLLGLPPDGHGVDIGNPLTLVRAIEEAAQGRGDALLVLDGLGSMAMQAGVDRFSASWPRIVAASRRFQEALAVYVDWDPSPKGLTTFGDEVRLLGVEDRIITHEYFRVRPAGGEASEPVLYHARNGGVRVYVPKIVVAGAGYAGKTTLVASLCDKVVNTDRVGTTVAGDRGTCRLDGIDVEIFGTPGQARFDPLLPYLIGKAVGVLLMVDATNPDDFQRARQILKMVRGSQRHVTIVANKQDVEGAIEPERLAAFLGITDDTPIVGCDARHPSSARHALGQLLQDVLQTRTVIA